MKLEIREIVSSMVGSTEPRMNLQAPAQSEVIALAGRIPLRDVLTEMHLIADSGTDLGRGAGAVVNATSNVVALAAAHEPLPVESTGLRRTR
jgi:hypothetical protein